MDFKKRVATLQGCFAEKRLDALIIATIEGNNKNTVYLSGFGGSTGFLIVSKENAALVVDGRYTLRAQEEARGVSVVEVKKDLGFIRTALSALGLTEGARIGFEADRVSVSMANAWKEVCPNLIPTQHLVETLRHTKDADEITLLMHACSVTSTVLESSIEQIVPGMREVDVARLLDFSLREVGASANSFETIVASGSNSAAPHHETGERVLESGDPVVIDFGGIFAGYCSDITRTIFVPGKEPDKELLNIYAIVLEANQMAKRALTLGMTMKEYDHVARSVIEKHGYGEYFTHSLGHSLGLEAHDPYDYTAPFAEGMVVTDEPGIYIPGLGGVRIEDDLVVTAHGARVLTPAQYWMQPGA